jgi:aminopeptidase YwaD
MKTIFSIFIAVFLTILLPAQTAITTTEIKEHIHFLASEEMKGRKPGSPEDKIIIQYLLKDFQHNESSKSDIQEFEIIAGIQLGNATTASIENTKLRLKEDFIPLSFSANAELTAKVVIIGYGFDINNEEIQQNDYQNIDVHGKWVLIFHGAPESKKVLFKYADFRSKVITAQSKGAAGVLLVSPSHIEKEDLLMPLFYDKVPGKTKIPVLNITRETANQLILLSEQDKSLPSIEYIEKELETEEHSCYYELSTKFSANISLEQDIIKTANVFGIVPGTDDKLKEEYFVVGAHYDHLGMGGKGSGSRMPDTTAVHYGADDNASGVAVVLELAEFFAANPLQRSIIFVAFGAEEMGLLGSQYFIDNPPVNKEKIACMLNFDMIGRLNSGGNNLNISGTGTAIEFDSILTIHSKRASFQLSRNKDGYGASDHAMFYAQEIPVLAFFTGIHTDYHTPFDNIDKIDVEGTRDIADFAVNIIESIDNLASPPAYQNTGDAPKRGKHSRKFKVTLGIIPDFADNGGKGMGVTAVKKDEAADRGGMQNGDIITAVNGNTVSNIYDYMHQLEKLRSGETAIVEVLRGEEKIVLLIQL